MKNRITNPNIKNINDNEIFVFGSNLSGIHGGGAARFAMNFGAIYGNGIGIQGNTYAIPTKSHGIERTLDIDEIESYVSEFLEFAKAHKEYTFLVTEIGCGLAGLIPEDVAPLFVNAINIENVHLPERFWKIIV